MKRYLLFILLIAFNMSSVNAQCPESTDPGVHVVQKGETLYRIADNYDVTVSRLLKWNKLEYGETLRLCQKLYVDAFAVPAGGPAKASKIEKPNRSKGKSKVLDRILDKEEKNEEKPATEFDSTSKERINTKKRRKQSGNRHIVQPGETMAMLADLYGYTEKRFRELNAMRGAVEVTPGSLILSSDCNCDRINWDDSGETKVGNTGGSTGEDEWEFDDDSLDEEGNTADAESSGPAPTIGGTSMSNLELTMVDEINLMRSNPSGYVRYVQAYVADQKANNGFPIDDRVVGELIRELRKSPVLSNLQPLSCIYTAAQKHGEDLRNMGQIEHQGSDGLWPWDRVKNACSKLTDGNENLVGGPESVRESVIILLIDEGIPNRGHRVTLMRPDWKYVACYKVGDIGQMPNVWVQKFGY